MNGKTQKGTGLITGIDDGGFVIDGHLRIRPSEVVEVLEQETNAK
jgi:hypothetical protein